MARMTADARRDLLVEAAIRVMARDGVAKTTTRSIVAEAGMPLGVFHYCFRSKHELLETVIEAITSHSLTDVMAVVNPSDDPRTMLRNCLQAYFDHVMTAPREHQMTYELTQYALREPGFEEIAKRQYTHYLTTNEAVLEQLAEVMGQRWTTPIPVIARILFTVLDGLTLNWLVVGDGDTFDGVLDAAADQLAGMLEPA